MNSPLQPGEVFGLVHPARDAHTLGISTVASLLREANHEVVIGGRPIAKAVDNLENPDSSATLIHWIRQFHITRLGMSCRLDAHQAIELVERLRFALQTSGHYGPSAHQIRGLYFAGLPAACEIVIDRFGNEIAAFSGDESAAETLIALGIPEEYVPNTVIDRSTYDRLRLEAGRRLISQGDYALQTPPDRSGYTEFGTSNDSLSARLKHARKRDLGPLIRSHYGPYRSNREGAIQEFLAGMREIASGNHVDILSIATSQLTQEKFGQPWGDQPNGGGVPINSEDEFRQTAAAAMPMLIRSYAGTTRIPELAQMYERSFNTAWHALSFWWFSRIDGRGPHSVLENLQQHMAALEVIGKSGKPFEPNIPHHFSFRGGDDLTCVLSAVIAAKVARLRGIRRIVLQIMLNTPKATAGIQDLAKARAMIALVHRHVGPDCEVIVQPRAGLDYLSADRALAKSQLAAATFLMDDINPGNSLSPPVIHVVGYSEATELATPAVIAESAQITRCAILENRRRRLIGEVPDMSNSVDVALRTGSLVSDVEALLAAIERTIPSPYSPEGLHLIFSAGFLLAPDLWEDRDEFAGAVGTRTALLDGGVVAVDQTGRRLAIEERIGIAVELARQQQRNRITQHCS